MAYRDCPNCGCNDTEVTKQPDPARGVWWGSGSAKCAHCGIAFSFRPPVDGTPDGNTPARIIPQLTCAECGGEMKVTQTRNLLRWYKCVDCGATAKVARKDAKE